MSQGDLASAETCFVDAEEILKDEDPSPLVLHGIAWASLFSGYRLDYNRTYLLGGWALSKAKKLGDSFTVIQRHFCQGMALGNHGRISAALDILHEGLRLGELNDDRYWIARIPNTIGWLHRELEDMETALRMDRENVQLAREMGFPEGEANSHVNLGYDYLSLGEPHRAMEHLKEAQRIYDTDEWFRWRYNIRLQAELARYWIIQGDLYQASTHARNCQAAAQKYLSRKYLAWSHKLLGDIATLEERVEDAWCEFNTALTALRDHRCPPSQICDL